MAIGEANVDNLEGNTSCEMMISIIIIGFVCVTHFWLVYITRTSTGIKNVADKKRAAFRVCFYTRGPRVLL